MSEIMRNELGNPALIRGRISPGSYEETFIKSVPPKGISKVDHEVIHFPF